jgi:hypothetical protein
VLLVLLSAKHSRIHCCCCCKKHSHIHCCCCKTQPPSLLLLLLLLKTAAFTAAVLVGHAQVLCSSPAWVTDTPVGHTACAYFPVGMV